MMIIFIVASSYVFVSKLNANVRDYSRRATSFNELNEAKAALIGYAVNYPLDHADKGPGHLPCPDITNNGSAGSSCVLSPNATTVGRLPWKTLELDNLRDAAGETLWYAVADNYRSSSTIGPNSDTTGNFSVDGNSDVVAVIFAPGIPITGQNRSADPLDVSNYLEDDNANGDTNFVSRSANEINDTLVTITRQELMNAIEKRVLGYVDEALSLYQIDPDDDDVVGVDADCGADPTCDNAFPWLSNFTDPSTSAFRSSVGTRQGHIPFHWANDPGSVASGGSVVGKNPFTTNITLTWSILSAVVSNPGTTTYGDSFGFDYYGGSMVTPDQDCIENSSCIDGNYAGLNIVAPITFTNASCTWTNKESFQCTGTFVNTTQTAYPQQTVPQWGYSFNIGPNELIYINSGTDLVIGEGLAIGWQWNTQIQYAYVETVTRTYTIDITFTDSSSDGAEIQAPTTTTTRTRDVIVSSADSGDALYSTGATSISITINDDRQIVATLDGGGTTTLAANSTRTLTNDADTTGSIAATGILYDIDIDGYDSNADGDYVDTNEKAPELPEWFVKNGWQDLIYVAYPNAEALPGGTTTCTSGVDCLSVNIDGTTNTDIRAIALSAGSTLALQNRGASPDEDDFFDDAENTDSNDVFLKSKITSVYNDQTRIISTVP